MLKKSDLAKQFELVVQQEIKNYQDSLNFVLQSINEIKGSILDNHKEFSEKHSFVHNILINLNIELQELKESNSQLSQKCERTKTDQKFVNERNTIEMRDISSALLAKINDQNNFQVKIENLWKEIYKLKSDTATNKRTLNESLDDLLRRFRQEILKAKTDILETPTEASLIKTQLEEKISRHVIDVEGIMKELRVFKQHNMITEKKIENIYTLIERLKKSEIIP